MIIEVIIEVMIIELTNSNFRTMKGSRLDAKQIDDFPMQWGNVKPRLRN